MATNSRAADHMLPIVSYAQFEEGFQKRIPYAQFRPASKPDINRIPYAVALIHVAPGQPTRST
jgi:hypothetical protein